MTFRATIRLVLFSAILLTTAVHPLAAENKPVNFGNGYRIDSSRIHLFLPSTFLENIRRERTVVAHSRYYHEEFSKAKEKKNYVRALKFCDSLTSGFRGQHIRGTHYAQIYRDRARLLHALHRDSDACDAYVQALHIQDSIMQYQQNDDVQEMQTQYELNRLSLDQELQRAHHHRIALVSLLLVLLAILAVVIIIYRGNRRTKRLQRELYKKIDLARESEKQKTAFINSMCHEVRTPLNCLSGFSELLCSGEITPEIFVQYHDIIRDSRRQLRYVLEDMLEVAYLENLPSTLPREYVDLCALCRIQLRAARVKYARTDITFTSGIPNEDLGMSTNEKYLVMLINELLDNAQKFTKEGSVLLECGRDGQDKAYIAVTDTGCGIPAEQREHIFERFVKLDTFSQGNGLGLYLALLIVSHLDGVIHIDPEHTGGTRIVVTLPRK